MKFRTHTDDFARHVSGSFAKQSMMTTFGATLDHVAAGAVTISAPLLPGSLQQQGFGHAALTFGIGDSAAGYAALTLLAPDAEVLTAEMKINLLAPATGERLIARGRVIKPGRRLVVVQSEIVAVSRGSETLIALMQGTMVPTGRDD